MSPPQTRDSPRTWKRINGVDLLRGLAILFVLMNHVNMRLRGAHVPYTRGLPDQLVNSLVWNGQYGVQIFFTISGYLITATSIRRWQTPGQLSVRGFYRLRFARIAPLLLLLVSTLSVLHLAHVPGFVVSRETGGLPRALLAALTFHINLLEARRGYLPPSWDILWSLSVEEAFYLLFPWVARWSARWSTRVLPTRRLLITLLALFLLAGPFARVRAFNPNPVWREYSFLGGMDAIALGCLTAMLLSRPELLALSPTARPLSRRAVILCTTLGAALVAFILCLSIKAYIWGLTPRGLDMTVLALGTSLLIAASAQTSWRAPRVLSPLLALGRNSYEIYLTHIFAVLALFAAFVHLGTPLPAVPALFLLVIVTAGILGWITARLYTEPLNRLLRAHAEIDVPTPTTTPPAR